MGGCGEDLERIWGRSGEDLEKIWRGFGEGSGQDLGIK